MSLVQGYSSDEDDGPVAAANDVRTMSLTAAKMRLPGAPKPAKALVFSRARSTTAAATASVSMLEAKSRVREHVRNISQTTARDAVAAPSV